MTQLAHILAYLLLAHVLAEFVLQSETAAGNTNARLRHLRAIAVAHTLAAALLYLTSPWWQASSLLLWPAAIAAHVIIDRITTLLERRIADPLRSLLLGQGMHVASLAGIAAVAADDGRFRVQPPLPWSSTDDLAVLIVAYITCAALGSRIVKLVLQRYTASDDATDPPSASDANATPAADSLRMGHAIGVLERSLGLTFVLLGSWTGLAGIIAAKSIARFKALEERRFGEYYLIGTLTSLLVTVAIGAVTITWLERLY